LKSRPLAVVTSTRADWGLLRSLSRKLLEAESNFKLIVTGSHLDLNGDLSVNEIDPEFKDKIIRVDILTELPQGSEVMFSAISQGMKLYPQVLREINPRLVVLLGDRYEIMAMAWACRLLGVPVVHFSGGELTLGAFDDSMRHCITKLADYHFVSTQEHYDRVRQLGENPKNIFNVGELAFADLQNLKYKSKIELEKEYNFDFSNFFLITVHPETCRVGRGMEIVRNIVKAVNKFSPEANLLFTAANLDPEGLKINDFLISEEKVNPRLKFVRSLGRLNYLSAAMLCTCVLGNSSSGVLEIPALGVPVINIGNRQKGRAQDQLVTNSHCDENSIFNALKIAAPFQKRLDKITNNSVKEAAKIILQLKAPAKEKPFYDLFP
jgi:UDP-hydrolysing UDP-N-acetyl-D-glucosamine 2-epimerase